MASPINPRLLREAAATKWYVVGVGAVGVVQSLLIVLQATLMAGAIAHVFYKHDLDGVAQTAGMVVGLFAVRGLLTWLSAWLAHRASAAVKSSLRRRVMAARLARPEAQTPTASLVTVMTTGLDAIDGYFGQYLPQFLMAATVPVIVGVAVGFHDLTSVIIVIVTVPLIPAFMILIGWTTSQQVARRFRVQMHLANHFADLVAGLPTLQVFGRARAQAKGLRKSEDASRVTTMSTLRVAFLSAGVLELMATLSVAIIAVSIALRTVVGGLDLYTALYILILAPEVYLPIRMVGVHFHDSANGDAAAAAAYAIIDGPVVEPVETIADVDDSEEPALVKPASSEPSPGVILPKAGPHSDSLLTFADVVYRYPGSDVDALGPLSLSVGPGEIVALAGPSGAGKTTALELALGVLTPASGHVVVGSGELTQGETDEWRRHIAWAGQTPGLLGPTVADDIALGLPPGQVADEAVLRDALDRVGGESIALDHSVGDDGEELSAGERRRVAVARALLRVERGGARLLLLDEPTAGLDEARETQILTTLRDLGVGVLVVSHREAVLSAADRVVEVAVPSVDDGGRSCLRQDDGETGSDGGKTGSDSGETGSDGVAAGVAR